MWYNNCAEKQQKKEKLSKKVIIEKSDFQISNTLFENKNCPKNIKKKRGSK